MTELRRHLIYRREAVVGWAADFANTSAEREIHQEIADGIYQAAFLPEFWSDALSKLADATGAASAEFLTFSRSGEPLYKTTPASREALSNWIESGRWRECEKPRIFVERAYQGFRFDAEVLTPAEIARDPANPHLSKYGLGGQVASIITLPTGDLGCFTFERWLRDGPPDSRMVSILDEHRPHLARAALIAARLELEKAQMVVSALSAVGIPAAVLRGDGRVATTNNLLDAMPDLVRAEAFGRIALVDKRADVLFKTAIESAHVTGQAAVRSIGIPASKGKQPFVVHILPLRRNARDLFPGGELMVAVTVLDPIGGAPPPSILSALFDLSPAEAKLAAGLVEGRALKDVAANMKVTYSTARTYLGRVFEKTGTKRQSELVALLKGAQSFETQGH